MKSCLIYELLQNWNTLHKSKQNGVIMAFVHKYLKSGIPQHDRLSHRRKLIAIQLPA